MIDKVTWYKEIASLDYWLSYLWKLKLLHWYSYLKQLKLLVKNQLTHIIDKVIIKMKITEIIDKVTNNSNETYYDN